MTVEVCAPQAQRNYTAIMKASCYGNRQIAAQGNTSLWGICSC